MTHVMYIYWEFETIQFWLFEFNYADLFPKVGTISQAWPSLQEGNIVTVEKMCLLQTMQLKYVTFLKLPAQGHEE